MPPDPIERVPRQVLLSDKDQANADVIIERGFAANVSQAIRVGLAFAARFTATTP